MVSNTVWEKDPLKMLLYVLWNRYNNNSLKSAKKSEIQWTFYGMKMALLLTTVGPELYSGIDDE